MSRLDRWLRPSPPLPVDDDRPATEHTEPAVPDDIVHTPEEMPHQGSQD